jgi:hypothetical protein
VTRRNEIRGNVTRGNKIRGNVVRGNVTRRNVFAGNCAFGKMVHGEMVRGETIIRGIDLRLRLLNKNVLVPLEQDQQDALEQFAYEVIDANDDKKDEEILLNSKKAMNGVRCAAYTLQQVVKDVCNDVKDGFKDVRTIVQEMRKIQHSHLYIKAKIPLPFYDVDTRWMSSFMMVKNIKDHSQFYKSLNEDPEIDLNIHSDTFKFMDNFIEAFESLYVTTEIFQTN